jgi:hypothetical protein
MKLTKVNDNLQVWVPTKPTRDNSFIADIDLAEHCPEFWHKCFDVLHDPKWAYSQKAFATSVMNFYDDWSYISWKQYDSIMGLYINAKETAKELRLKNAKYMSERACNLGKSGWKSLENFTYQTWEDHVLPQMTDDDLIGRFLPTDEMLENMWCNLATTMYPEAAPMARALGLSW